MTSIGERMASRTTVRWLLALLAMSLIGCDVDARFHLNNPYVHSLERKNDTDLTSREQEVANALTALFGTPDEPALPQLADNPFEGVVEEGKLVMAAGAVGLDEETQRPRGLYREHCSHCHGVSGNGIGPTASFLNPYPRDFRRGTYKFKSTPEGARPTHADLTKTLTIGISGTAMPSFRLLPEDERDSLVHYVKYLSIRGQVERKIWTDIVSEMGEDEHLSDEGNLSTIRDIVTEIAQGWADADSRVVEQKEEHPRPEGPELAASIQRGRELFHGPVAACSTCHGVLALGDGRKDLYDTWTQELEPTKPDALQGYLNAGALTPRIVKPRNLRLGVYRGGRRRIDLYWRIRNGIEGAGMPAAPMRPPTAGPEVKGLTEDDLWNIIDYVQALPYEPMSQPPKNVVENTRTRSS